MTHRSALNLSYQDRMPVTGQPECLLSLVGQDLIGTPLSVRTPLPSSTWDVMYWFCQLHSSCKSVPITNNVATQHYIKLCLFPENALFVKTIAVDESMTYFASLILHHLSCLSYACILQVATWRCCSAENIRTSVESTQPLCTNLQVATCKNRSTQLERVFLESWQAWCTNYLSSNCYVEALYIEALYY